MIPLILLLFVAWSCADEVVPNLRVDMQPPEELQAAATRNVHTAFITMPVDHFDPQNADTFQMRFMYNEDYFGGDGYPVFILVGGEWSIAEGWLRGGNMFQMAVENRGYQFYTEHRYYGQTLPYTEFTAENLRFLNVDQALADLAYFIKELKKQPRFANSKIILYGGSYAGNMVLWFKQRYPHLVLGTVASSAPILAEVDFTGYLEVVHDAFLSEGGEQCITTIRQGILDTVAAMETEAGRRSLEAAYRLCEPLDYDDELTLGYFSGMITWRFSGVTQTASPGRIITVCNNFRTNAYGETPMQKIGGFIAVEAGLQDCWSGLNFQSLLNLYSSNNNNRAWYYQTCTEYGYFQNAPRSGTVFDPLKWLDISFYAEICKEAFNERFDESFILSAASRVNQIFGGLRPDVNNTINIHGTIDPWHALGVHNRDLKETSPTFTVPRASHCFDMQNWLSTDTIQMTQVKQNTRRIVGSWLND
ncbi:putative serine protease K12H4.7 [Plodia interpunctella]|uniref:putative serine protease K12H4.7 n=1 Tax=Plodia interpunctella TaxID=58824 RepID=UPI00236784E7|nr:putative serine protease K12H4.7 [Plodia interpunctella]